MHKFFHLVECMFPLAPTLVTIPVSCLRFRLRGCLVTPETLNSTVSFIFNLSATKLYNSRHQTTHRWGKMIVLLSLVVFFLSYFIIVSQSVLHLCHASLFVVSKKWISHSRWVHASLPVRSLLPGTVWRSRNASWRVCVRRFRLNRDGQRES